ncbi:metallophosphoesterase [Tuanshanicoccus lijuaniae]|uniref:metallophosphoesterase n=1 Tax=Aerococcaceae bacterium zg-1292 TaxID=2774330 RepID=UPI001BD85A8E|nr:metallophosphoesterase [Aerococcaceae bacterium zg-A91]MBS4458065.1 metallophosphoesterase [Aerococcaceae bacterium zg-BR33]
MLNKYTTAFLLAMLLWQIATPVSAQADTSVWVITDVHYLSPSLHDKGEAYQHIQKTSAGKDFDYSSARMEALISEVQSAKPDSLIVSGDLSLNGEYQSMVDLAKYFDRIEALGTQVYVIPGNHDISSGWARKFAGEDFIRTRQVLPSDFKALFADHGYNEAFDHDDRSLSYAVALNDSTWLLMIDSNVYSQTKGSGAPPTNGIIKKGTLTWIESILKQAKEKQVHILPVVHHNTLTHFSQLEKNYTLDNAVDFRELLFQYNIPITISGHIHTQHVAQIEERGHTLTDIVTGAFASYPSYIGKYRINNESIRYTAEPVNVEQWAKRTQQTDKHLTEYSTYMAELFNISSRQMAFREMIEGGWYHDDEPILEDVADYVALVNLAFFAGKPLESFDLSSFNDLNHVRQLIEENSSQFFKRYLQQIEQDQPDFATPIERMW